jgi:PucR C-terminal helix-turn-helix domain
MTEIRQASVRATAALSAVPRELAVVMRPELPSLLKEMTEEIIAALPEYRHLLEGPDAELVHLGIKQNVTAFVNQVAAPQANTELRDEICRSFGRFEAYQGRSLDVLQDAYRIGCQVALRRAREVGHRYRLSAAVLMSFADALFAYMGEIAELSREGYLRAMIDMGEEPDGRRRRLMQRILTGAVGSDSALAELAEQVGWPLPEEITPVALRRENVPSRAVFDRHVLADLGCPEPYLLLPGPLDGPGRALLAGALGGCRAAVGPTVPLARAADSLRWARHTLVLVDLGVIPDGAPTLTEGNLLTLWLLSDPALVAELSRRCLAPLAEYTATQRRRLLETLHVWLTSRGTAAQIAEQLGVHPQTFRYRMRLLERIFGEQLTDPTQRFATEVALRALALRDPDAEPATAAPTVVPPGVPGIRPLVRPVPGTALHSGN